MPLNRVTSGNNSSFNSGYAVGDLLVILAYNKTSTTIPSTPVGYTLLTSATNSSSGSTAMAVFYKVALLTTEVYPVIVNADSTVYAIYTIQAATPLVQTGGQASSGLSSTISYSGIVSYQNPGVDWVITFACGNASSAAIGSHPANNMTLVTNGENSGSGFDIAIFDSNGPLSSYSFNSKTLGAAVAWMTKTVELVAAATSTKLVAPVIINQAVNRAARY